MNLLLATSRAIEVANSDSFDFLLPLVLLLQCSTTMLVPKETNFNLVRRRRVEAYRSIPHGKGRSTNEAHEVQADRQKDM